MNSSGFYKTGGTRNSGERVRREDHTAIIKATIMPNLSDRSLEAKIDNVMRYEGRILSRIWEMKQNACSEIPVDKDKLMKVNIKIHKAIDNLTERAREDENLDKILIN